MMLRCESVQNAPVPSSLCHQHAMFRLIHSWMPSWILSDETSTGVRPGSVECEELLRFVLCRTICPVKSLSAEAIEA